MPIRKENKCRYPANWKAIREKILERAEHKCENCGAENYKPHPKTGSSVVLTIAHLDHTPENCSEENLRAWCQKCHNSYDAPMRAKGIKERRLKKIKNSTIPLLFLLVCLLPAPLFAQSPGDVNQSGSVNIADVMCLVDYIFNGVEIPRTEWVEVDTTVSVVQILDRPFTIRDWPIKAQNHFYVTTLTQYDTIEVLGWGDTVLLIDSTTIVDTTVIREYIITEATYPSGSQLIKTR